MLPCPPQRCGRRSLPGGAGRVEMDADMANPPTPDAWAPSKFPKSLRGYSPSPVDDAIAAAMEQVPVIAEG